MTVPRLDTHVSIITGGTVGIGLAAAWFLSGFFAALELSETLKCRLGKSRHRRRKEIDQRR